MHSYLGGPVWKNLDIAQEGLSYCMSMRTDEH